MVTKKWDRKYLVSLKFRGRAGNTTTNDLTYPGYLDAIHNRLISLETQLVRYDTPDGGKSFQCIVRAVANVEHEDEDGGKSCRTYTAFGEATSVDAPYAALVRYAETRAKKRCFATALNLTQYDFNNPDGVAEEEYGTPITTSMDDNQPEQSIENTKTAKLMALADKVRANQSKRKTEIIDADAGSDKAW